MLDVDRLFDSTVTTADTDTLLFDTPLSTARDSKGAGPEVDFKGVGG